jgi:Zn finger protein HypA/HybF involved in hydrogenase expression
MNPPPSLHNRFAVLATMHRKEQAIAPLLEQELGIKTIVPPNLNTDIFGTFTRNVKRLGTQIEAARAKAVKAIDLTGETLAIASEGSFRPHPVIPYLAVNCEIVLLLDQSHGLELVGQAISTATNYRHQLVESLQQAQQFAQEVGFPEHGLVVMGGDSLTQEAPIIKGITSEEQLADAFEVALRHSSKVHLETDMRALYNPSRMKVIHKATQDLLRKIAQTCPQCSYPGFDIVERKPGLPCGLCHQPTQLTLFAVYRCEHCGFTKEELFPDGRSTVDPGECEYCNP